jgi:GNAT superfamily N-acetyltransferase
MGAGAAKSPEGPPVAELRPMARTARDLELFDACFTANGAPRDRDVLRWQYLDNPTGALFVDFATASADRLAAIYASIPVVFRVAGEQRLGIQSVDTMTDREFRGRGLFLQLAKQTYARAADAGVALVYGTPNGSSAHGFFQRLEWQTLDPVPFLIRPLRARWVLEKLGLPRAAARLPDLRIPVGRGRADARRVERFDERFTRLWHELARGIGVAVERDARYLGWRLAKPGEDYRSFCVDDRDGELSAFASHCTKTKERSRIGYIMEALCTPRGTRALRGLIRGALADMAASGADVALAWCLPHSPTYAAFLRTGFVPFPRRLWPIELHLGARSFDPALAAQVNDRRAWYLSYLDCDTV